MLNLDTCEPPMGGTMVHYAGFSNPNRTRPIAQLWDFIETSSFREDIKGIEQACKKYFSSSKPNNDKKFPPNFFGTPPPLKNGFLIGKDPLQK